MSRRTALLFLIALQVLVSGIGLGISIYWIGNGAVAGGIVSYLAQLCIASAGLRSGLRNLARSST